MVKVSILCPAYNGEEFIEQNIQSVLDQSFQDWEYIICDDVSTDKTADIVKAYAKKYPKKIRLVQNTVNKGQAGALNTALREAKGKYIVTLDTDDVLVVPDSLKERVEYLESHPETSMIYTDGFYMSEDGSQVSDYNSFSYDSQMLHSFNFIPNGSAMIKRIVVLDVGSFDESLRTCQDYDLWLRVQAKGYKMEKVAVRSYKYRQHKGQKSRTKLLTETLKKIHDKWKHTVASIVVPVYNGEKTIRGCLDSVLAQKCSDYDINQNWECIVVDDGSTDKTAEIIQEYVTKDARFRYVKNEKNMGIGYTRNRGIDEAKGDFICFISADDEMMPDYVLAMIKTNQVYPNAILYSDYFLFNDEGVVCGVVQNVQYSAWDNLVVAAISQAEYNKMFVCYNCFAPAQIWRENKFDPDLRMGEDLEHLLRCLLVKRLVFICVKAPLFKYRVGSSTTTSKNIMKIPENNKRIKQKINEVTGKKIFEV